MPSLIKYPLPRPAPSKASAFWRVINYTASAIGVTCASRRVMAPCTPPRAVSPDGLRSPYTLESQRKRVSQRCSRNLHSWRSLFVLLFHLHERCLGACRRQIATGAEPHLGRDRNRLEKALEDREASGPLRPKGFGWGGFGFGLGLGCCPNCVSLSSYYTTEYYSLARALIN